MVNAEDKDGISTASATVTVFVQDTADEIPVFEQPKYQANVIENLEDTSVVTVTAIGENYQELPEYCTSQLH